jgi:hypothetical protein
LDKPTTRLTQRLPTSVLAFSKEGHLQSPLFNRFATQGVIPL